MSSTEGQDETSRNDVDAKNGTSLIIENEKLKNECDLLTDVSTLILNDLRNDLLKNDSKEPVSASNGGLGSSGESKQLRAVEEERDALLAANQALMQQLEALRTNAPHLHHPRDDRFSSLQKEHIRYRRETQVELNDLRRKVAHAQHELARASGTATQRERLIERANQIYSKLRPWAGIEIPKEEQEQSTEGVTIVGIRPHGPADRAGLRANDVVVSVNDEDAENNAHLTRIVHKMKPGNELRMEIARNGDIKRHPIQVCSKNVPYEDIVRLMGIAAGNVEKNDHVFVSQLERRSKRTPTNDRRTVVRVRSPAKTRKDAATRGAAGSSPLRERPQWNDSRHVESKRNISPVREAWTSSTRFASPESRAKSPPKIGWNHTSTHSQHRFGKPIPERVQARTSPQRFSSPSKSSSRYGSATKRTTSPQRTAFGRAVPDKPRGQSAPFHRGNAANHSRRRQKQQNNYNGDDSDGDGLDVNSIRSPVQDNARLTRPPGMSHVFIGPQRPEAKKEAVVDMDVNVVGDESVEKKEPVLPVPALERDHTRIMGEKKANLELSATLDLGGQEDINENNE